MSKTNLLQSKIRATGLELLGGQDDLGFQLYILNNDATDYSGRKKLGFTVVNLDKARGYPLNFVCVLPLRITSSDTKLTTFERRFGDKSLEVAKELLTSALKTEGNEYVRSEIERRLKLLNPDSTREKTCSSCGKTFQTNPKKKINQRYCEGCLRKKFGSRTI
jgi:hypothetical protein